MFSGDINYQTFILISIIILIIFFWLRNEHFANQPSALATQITNEAINFFGTKDQPPLYKDYQKVVTDADPVQFYDTYRLWTGGDLTAKNVDKIIRN